MNLNTQRIYRELMRETRYRNLYIQAIGNNPQYGVYPQTRIESICLQIRMILENIALACLVANGDRLDQLPRKIEKEYHAETILRRLDTINPDCYPKPLVLVPGENPPKIQEIRDSRTDISVGRYRGELVDRPGNDWLTRDEFMEIYGRLGGILHAGNPLGSMVDYNYFESNAPLWQEKYMNLLEHHKISVIEENMMYIVQMNAVPENSNDNKNGDVNVTAFNKIMARESS